MNKQIKRVFPLLLIFVMLLNLVPTKVDAHRAYFLQVLIDEGDLKYISNIMLDSSFREKKKIESELWEYDGTQSIPTSKEEYEKLDKGSKKRALLFSFPSTAIKGLGNFRAQNNASSRDEARAHEISDMLIPNLNELLIIANGGKKFTEMDDLIDSSIKLAQAVRSRSSNYKGIDFSSKWPYATYGAEGGEAHFLVSMKKGYSTKNLEPKLTRDGKLDTDLPISRLYEENASDRTDFESVDEINIADMITMGNYTYIIKDHTALDTGEYQDPGTIGTKLLELLSHFIASLRSVLGLRDINTLVFNEGIVGSSQYYNGLMPAAWYQKSIAFHLVFQAMTWIALGLSIIKLATQRNLATVSASARISLMDGIKDLIVAGFMLMGVFLAINLMGTLNSAIVNIFSNTVNFDDAGTSALITGHGTKINTMGGVIMQLYYLLITIYLNVIYIARAISLSILIAVAPIFIGSIAFQTRSKDFFESWLRLLVADIFVQSFHAFTLSFFLSLQMSTTRGIELAVISFSLIPATKLFKEMITRSSGGLMEGAGAGLMMAGGVAMGGLAGAGGGGRGGGSNYKGSADETGGMSTGTPTKRDTTNAMNTRKTESSSDSTSTIKPVGGLATAKRGLESLQSASKNLGNKAVESFEEQAPEGLKNAMNATNQGMNTIKDTAKAGLESGTQMAQAGIDKLPEGVQKGISTAGAVAGATAVKGQNVGRQLAQSTPSIAKNAAKGGAKIVGGAALGMAYGGMGGAGMSNAMNMMSSGAGHLSNSAFTAKDAATTGFNQQGNMLGARSLGDGNVAVHRDRQSLQNSGLESVQMRENEDTNSEDLSLTYNPDNLSQKDLVNLNTIQEKYKEGDTEYLESKGISNVYDSPDGNVSVDYNEFGKEQLGYSSAYMNKNEIVEIKKDTQELDSNLTYDINKATPITATESTENIGPGDAGQSEESGQPYMGGMDPIDDGPSNLDLDNIM